MLMCLFFGFFFQMVQDNYSDMYSRVKRARRRVKQDMYGIPIPDQGEETEASESDAEGRILVQEH